MREVLPPTLWDRAGCKESELWHACPRVAGFGYQNLSDSAVKALADKLCQRIFEFFNRFFMTVFLDRFDETVFEVVFQNHPPNLL